MTQSSTRWIEGKSLSSRGISSKKPDSFSSAYVAFVSKMSGKTRSQAPLYLSFVKRAGKQERKLAPRCTKKRFLVTNRLEPNTQARVNSQRSVVRKLKLLKIFSSCRRMQNIRLTVRSSWRGYQLNLSRLFGFLLYTDWLLQRPVGYPSLTLLIQGSHKLITTENVRFIFYMISKNKQHYRKVFSESFSF